LRAQLVSTDRLRHEYNFCIPGERLRPVILSQNRFHFNRAATAAASNITKWTGNPEVGLMLIELS